MRLSPITRLPDGAFTRAGAKTCGVSSYELDQLLEVGRVVRVVRGVYRRSDTPDSLELRVAAVALIRRPFWIFTDRTAAWLHGIDVLRYHELELLPPLDVISLRGNSRVRHGACNGGERDLRPEDVMQRGAVKLTTPVRTAMDLGCKLSRREALAALDAFMRDCGVTREDMHDLLPRYFGRRGVKQLRELMPLATPLAESSGESWARLAIIDAGLPAPTPQVWVLEGGRRKFRVDLAYEKCKIAIEYDGAEFHDGDERAEHDRRRRAWLREHGWTVIVVRRDSFSGAALEVWLNELRAALPAAA
jgi:hypothetical protein